MRRWPSRCAITPTTCVLLFFSRTVEYEVCEQPRKVVIVIKMQQHLSGKSISFSKRPKASSSPSYVGGLWQFVEHGILRFAEFFREIITNKLIYPFSSHEIAPACFNDIKYLKEVHTYCYTINLFVILMLIKGHL